MIYVDTSSFLKLLLPEKHSAEVRDCVAAESQVVVSELTELEADVQLRALFLGGGIRKSALASARARMSQILLEDPIERIRLTRDVFRSAMAQNRISKTHCRSLDRLHLAAMEELRISRLMTHDARQAEAARELGYEVISPGL